MDEISKKIEKLEAHCRAADYSGHSKFDALNSPLLEACFGFSPLSRLLVTQAVNRIPLPLRQTLGVRRERNPKGIANFVKAYCLLEGAKENIHVRKRIEKLADWLLDNTSNKRGAFKGKGTGWGYNFPWQSPGFFAPRHFPNCIVTTFCAEALLAAYQVTQKEAYLDGSMKAATFILEDLPVLEEDDQIRCIGYVPTRLKWKVININAVAGGFLSKLAHFTGDPKHQQSAKKMIQWVLNARQPNHSWNYTEPKAQSGIGPDNYHTGGVLDGIFDYLLENEDLQAEKIYFSGLEFYRKNFFTPEGAPKWRVNRLYPIDTHGAAQGILSFSKAALIDPKYLDQAEKISVWTTRHLQHPKGFFFYQKRRLFTWKLELMRWNNSWMFWALAQFSDAQRKLNSLSRSTVNQ